MNTTIKAVAAGALGMTLLAAGCGLGRASADPVPAPTPPAAAAPAPAPAGTQWAPVAPGTPNPFDAAAAAGGAPAQPGPFAPQPGDPNGRGVVPAPKPAPAPTKTPATANPLTTVERRPGYEVGTGDGELEPGKWHTDGQGDGYAYASVRGAGNGKPVDVVSVDGPSTITLKAGQQFESHGGVTWTLKAAK